MTTKQRGLVAGGTMFLALGLLFACGCSDERENNDPHRSANSDDDDEWDYGPLLLLGGIGVFLGIGGWVLVAVTKRTQPGGGGAHEGLLYYRCVECKKKISYSRRRIGQKGPCPSCGVTFTFPAPSKDGKEAREGNKAATSPGKTAMRNPMRKSGDD
jgi:hypothetical protein